MKALVLIHVHMEGLKITSNLKWREEKVASWLEFIIALEAAQDSYRNPPTYIFRGQVDTEWDLKPSLLRCLNNLESREQHLQIENWLTEEFLAQAALFPETTAVWEQLMQYPRLIERWAYMQHHGCVTRLLDWTASPYIAGRFQ